MAMTKTFRDAFIEAVSRPGWSIRRVADLSEVSVEQLKKVHQGRSLSTNVDDAKKVANAFGLTLDEFLEDDTATVRAEIASLYSQLSKAEIAILRAAARGQRDQDREEGK